MKKKKQKTQKSITQWMDGFPTRDREREPLWLIFISSTYWRSVFPHRGNAAEADRLMLSFSDLSTSSLINGINHDGVNYDK